MSDNENDQANVKPEGGSKGEPINVKVVSSDGQEVHFKIKTTTKFSKLKAAYATRVGKAVESVRFLCDGQKVENDDTPGSLEMEDGDSIDAQLEQVGGRR